CGTRSGEVRRRGVLASPAHPTYSCVGTWLRVQRLEWQEEDLTDRGNINGDFTTLLAAVREGDDEAFRRLYERLYSELRRLAHSVRAGYGAETVNTTALVHEAYLKMAPSGALDARDREHFLRMPSRAMRQGPVRADRARPT